MHLPLLLRHPHFRLIFFLDSLRILYAGFYGHSIHFCSRLRHSGSVVSAYFFHSASSFPRTEQFIPHIRSAKLAFLVLLLRGIFHLASRVVLPPLELLRLCLPLPGLFICSCISLSTPGSCVQATCFFLFLFFTSFYFFLRRISFALLMQSLPHPLQLALCLSLHLWKMLI